MKKENIKKFLLIKARETKEEIFIIELYKNAETKKDFMDLFSLLLDIVDISSSYMVMKILCMTGMEVNSEQEVYLLLKSFYENSQEISTLSLLAFLETIKGVNPVTEYFNLERDLITHELNPKFCTKRIISIIEKSSIPHFEPSDQSVNKGSVFFLKKNIDPYLDMFLDEVFALFQISKNQLLTETMYTNLSNSLSKMSLWAVKINPSGSMSSHFHPKGILSGVTYLDVGNSSGSFVIGSPPSGIRDETSEKTVKIQPLKLITFPSYYYHKTLVHKSETMRFSMSFDISD